MIPFKSDKDPVQAAFFVKTTQNFGCLVGLDNLGFPCQNYHGFLATFAQIIFDYSMV